MPDPIAFEIGPLAVRWYGILISIALATGTFVAYLRAKRTGIDEEEIVNLVIIVAPIAIIGARIYYVIFNWSYYRENIWEIPAIWHGGIAIHGALLAGVLAVWLFAYIKKINFLNLLDTIVPGLVLGQSIGRWGNFFNQEAYGYETDLPWAMFIDGAYRHPTFLYESIWDLGLFLFLLIWGKKRKVTGDVLAVYLVIYSVGRFFIEGLRTDSLMIGDLRMAQIMSIAGILFGLGLFFWQRRKGRNIF